MYFGANHQEFQLGTAAIAEDQWPGCLCILIWVSPNKNGKIYIYIFVYIYIYIFVYIYICIYIYTINHTIKPMIIMVFPCENI